MSIECQGILTYDVASNNSGSRLALLGRVESAAYGFWGFNPACALSSKCLTGLKI